MPLRLWIAGCLLLACAAAQGAGFDPKVVSATAQWYVHVDVDAAHASPVVQKIREQILHTDRAQRHLQELKDKFHFDPTQQLHGITMYGKLDRPHHGVSVIRADFERGAVADQLKEKFEFKSTRHGDHEIYTWSNAGNRERDNKERRDGGKQRREHSVAIALLDGGTAVMAHSADSVGAALDVIDGKADPLSPLAADSVAGAILQGKVAGLSDAKLPLKSPVLAQCDRLSLSVSDLDGQWSANAQLGTKSAEAAGQIEAVLAGFRALAQLRHGSQAEVKAAIDNLDVSSNSNTVSIHWELGDEDALQLRDKVQQLCKEARERRHDHSDHPRRDRKPENRKN